MASHKSDLYNWQRFSKPKVHSSSQRIIHDDDIENWIKKVEDASSMAAAAAFGTKYSSTGRIKSTIAATVEDARIHDAAYSEAQDLLQQWVEDKINLSDDEEMTDESWARKTETEIKREWDHLVGGGGDTYDPPMELITGRSSKSQKDPYQILMQDDDRLVDDVLQRLMDKDVIESHVMDDLGLDDKKKVHPDPRTKMLLRHQQVKENREKRELEKKRKLKELHERKDAQLKARQIIMKEDQEKALQRKKEEDAIQREMAKIRKEMDDERKKKHEQLLRDQRQKEEFDCKVRQEMQRQQMAELTERSEQEKKTEYRQRLVMTRLKEIETREALNNMKLLQQCFSAWYNVIVERHLQAGKAKAMSDWKLLLRSFNAWKAYTRAKHVEKETLLYQAQVKLTQRKQVMADSFYKNKLLRRCMLSWQLFVFHMRQAKDLTSEQSKTKTKMAAFLEAAATGKLWSARLDKGQSSKPLEKSPKANDQQIEDMFDGVGRLVLPPGSSRSESSLADTNRSETTPGENRKNQLQSWQLSRKHVRVTKEELSKVAEKASENNSTESSVKLRKAFLVNNYENRHNAQQKLLENQQKQIKEQQRLIEEMHYLQKQQMLQQQLTQQQLITQTITQQEMLVYKGGWLATGQSTPGGQSKSAGQSTPQVTQLTLEDIEENENCKEKSAQNSETDRTSVSVASAATSQPDDKSTLSKSSANSKQAKFLQSMEERAKERSRHKQEREDKRRKMEEERLRALQEEEEKKLQIELEEKKRRAETYREKKRLEKQKEQEKEQQLENIKQQFAIATEHSRLGVVKYRGWLPWKKLVTMAAEDKQRAVQHHAATLMRSVLLSWHVCVQKELTEKRALADEMLKYTLTKRCFANWKKVGQYMIIEEQKAQRHYNIMLKVKVIRAWANHTTDEKMEMWKKERIAKEHNIRRVVLTAFRAWKRFPKMIKAEEERRKRLDEMRKKVTSILPDFNGVNESRTSSEFFS